ncbi:acetyltransferase-like isoleucine patch superfamily enzyme [Chryseobacterium defluvii]|uniref:Acetyltransferase-like isoleucine patch superfamily enzyme n=1 Tax=Chryseobacterium defluvii TaxID=160396 RepID=A0A840KF36_9FLAO|nr:acyltransferase [Chryseobacterium defluvii]MBB4806628.1 acetyltransferase-like isoleucine patch superfamily enzyme [Chryseobacterium defluvii]
MFYNFLEKINRKIQLSILKKHPKVFFKNIRLGAGAGFVLDKDLEKLSIGHSADFRNYISILVLKNATLEIGDRFFMNNFCSINCMEYISIGDNTLFGENVKIYDHNHAYETTPVFKVHSSEFTKAPVKIGSNCWLGSNVTILKGVTIGDNCIIGAGCTIYKDIPANTRVINKQDLTFTPL